MKNQGLSIKEITTKLQKYCAYQDRCHFEVEKKLREFFLIPEAKDQIILSLIEEGFLNEERFARNFARGKFKNNHWGKFKISMELKSRQISEYLIDKSISQEIDNGEYLDKIQYLIDKKSKELNGNNEFENNQKIMRYLQSKGYSYHEFADFFN